VKRLVFKSVPDESTRLVMLKRGETDIAYGFRGPDAEEVRRTAGLTLKPIQPTVSQWVVFTEQWDARSPWADRRVRLALNLAIDRKGLQRRRVPGLRPAGAEHTSRAISSSTGRRPPIRTIRTQARSAPGRGGYPKGFDAVEVRHRRRLHARGRDRHHGLQTIGIRARLRPDGARQLLQADQEKQFKRLVRVGSGAAGNAATRIEAFVISSGNPRLRRLPGHRRALPRPGRRAGHQATREPAAPDPAPHARARDVRAHRRAGGADRRGTARGGGAHHHRPPFISPYEDLRLR